MCMIHYSVTNYVGGSKVVKKILSFFDVHWATLQRGPGQRYIYFSVSVTVDVFTQ